MAHCYVPDSIHVLSAISENVARFCEEVLPDNTNEDAAEEIPLLLDALTFFLPTIPNDGRVYAMTLAVTEKEIVTTIAANEAAHFDPAPEYLDAYPESRHSPETILGNIWGFMTKLAVSTNEIDHSVQMIDYLHRVHALKIRYRFAKRSKKFEQFWIALSEDKVFGSAISSVSSIGYRYAKTSNNLKSYLEMAKAIFDYHQAFASTNDMLEVFKGITLPQPCSKLEESLSEYDMEYIVRIRQKANLHGFNLLRYIRKLCAPWLHIKTIKQTAVAYQFVALSTLPLRIYRAANVHCPPIPVTPVTPALVAEFLRNAYIRGPEDDTDYIQAAIQDRAKYAWTGTIPIAPPHCECLLVRHHELVDPSVPPPFPYIGVSKPSCFQCGIYLDAYNDCSLRLHERFSVTGRNNDVVPCSLATISDEFDSLMGDHMVGSIRRVVTAMLDEDIQDLESRDQDYSRNYQSSSEYPQWRDIADRFRARRVPR